MTELGRVFEWLDGSREEIIDLQRALTARAALGPDNGGTGEHEKADYILGILKELEPDLLEEVMAPDERAAGGYRPNLVALWKGESDSPTVWVLSHMDVVPPGDLSLWEGDPYEVRISGEKIVGRGVEDNQHGIVSSYLALKAVLRSGLRPRNSVGLIMVADEETGSRYGLAYLLEKRPDLFKTSDLIIVPDGGNRDGTMIEVAEKTMLWLRFTVVGKQCHASTPEKGRNSLYGVARLILELQRLRELFDFKDEMFNPPVSTFEPTKIEANVPNINTIPGKDVFYLDCRVLPRYPAGNVLGAVEEIAARLAGETGLQISVDPTYREDAAPPTPAEAPVVMALTRAVKRVSGLDARPMGIGGGTVASFFRKAGLPAAVWVTSPDTAHQPNEYCLIGDLIKDAKVFACVYME